MLTHSEAMSFLEGDNKFEDASFQRIVCKICGCIVDKYYLDVHRINCKPIKIEIKNASPNKS